MLTEKSLSDFDPKDKVQFIEKNGFLVAGEKDKDRLVEPVKFKSE